MTPVWPLVRIEAMIHRVAHLLVAVALVSASGSTPFAHVHPDGPHRAAPRATDAPDHSHSGHHQEQGAHWHLTGRQAADRPGSTTLDGDRHHHASVAVATVAVERPSVRGGPIPALAEVWENGVVPDPPSRPTPVAANARPNPPPRIVLAARAPPA